jgi:hypothetical protein
VKLIYARNCLARDSAVLIQCAAAQLPVCAQAWDSPAQRHTSVSVSDVATDSPALHTLYHAHRVV